MEDEIGDDMRYCALGLFLLAITCFRFVAAADVAPWPTVGGTAWSQHYSPLADVGKSNVTQLRLAWTYRSGDFFKGDGKRGGTALEVSPLMIDGSLYFCTPTNHVVALDAESGREKWKFDPHARLDGVYAPVCRGVAWWTAAAAPAAACQSRIFTNTVDAKLWAIDATTGKPCADFGD